MSFDETLASLGKELGLPLEVQDGRAVFEASFGDDGEDPVTVEISSDDDGRFAVLSTDIGELPQNDVEALATTLLEANHLFAATGGAALSVEGDRAMLERRVRLEELSRGEGANVIYPFIGLAVQWMRKLIPQLSPLTF